MFRKFAAMLIAGGLMVMSAPGAQAAAPVPGRFCKTLDAGKVVKTSKYGPVKCKMKEGRYRWVQI
jgi:hypothetical protein